MPFTPIGNGKYRSASGKIFTEKQVRLYYLTEKFKKMGKAKRLLKKAVTRKRRKK